MTLSRTNSGSKPRTGSFGLLSFRPQAAPDRTPSSGPAGPPASAGAPAMGDVPYSAMSPGSHRDSVVSVGSLTWSDSFALPGPVGTLSRPANNRDSLASLASIGSVSSSASMASFLDLVDSPLLAASSEANGFADSLLSFDFLDPRRSLPPSATLQSIATAPLAPAHTAGPSLGMATPSPTGTAAGTHASVPYSPIANTSASGNAFAGSAPAAIAMPEPADRKASTSSLLGNPLSLFSTEPVRPPKASRSAQSPAAVTSPVLRPSTPTSPIPWSSSAASSGAPGSSSAQDATQPLSPSLARASRAAIARTLESVAAATSSKASNRLSAVKDMDVALDFEKMLGSSETKKLTSTPERLRHIEVKKGKDMRLQAKDAVIEKDISVLGRPMSQAEPGAPPAAMSNSSGANAIDEDADLMGMPKKRNNETYWEFLRTTGPEDAPAGAAASGPKYFPPAAPSTGAAKAVLAGLPGSDVPPPVPEKPSYNMRKTSVAVEEDDEDLYMDKPIKKRTDMSLSEFLRVTEPPSSGSGSRPSAGESPSLPPRKNSASPFKFFSRSKTNSQASLDASANSTTSSPSFLRNNTLTKQAPVSRSTPALNLPAQIAVPAKPASPMTQSPSRQSLPLAPSPRIAQDPLPLPSSPSMQGRSLSLDRGVSSSPAGSPRLMGMDSTTTSPGSPHRSPRPLSLPDVAQTFGVASNSDLFSGSDSLFLSFAEFGVQDDRAPASAPLSTPAPAAAKPSPAPLSASLSASLKSPGVNTPPALKTPSTAGNGTQPPLAYAPVTVAAAALPMQRTASRGSALSVQSTNSGVQTDLVRKINIGTGPHMHFDDLVKATVAAKAPKKASIEVQTDPMVREPCPDCARSSSRAEKVLSIYAERLAGDAVRAAHAAIAAATASDEKHAVITVSNLASHSISAGSPDTENATQTDMNDHADHADHDAAASDVSGGNTTSDHGRSTMINSDDDAKDTASRRPLSTASMSSAISDDHIQQALMDENTRLYQELSALKLALTTERSKSEQMRIMKEAAEARFEQLARVAHRKLVQAMEDKKVRKAQMAQMQSQLMAVHQTQRMQEVITVESVVGAAAAGQPVDAGAQQAVVDQE